MNLKNNGTYDMAPLLPSFFFFKKKINYVLAMLSKMYD